MAVAHGQRVIEAGEPLESAHAAMILLHGRGATAEDIMTIAAEIRQERWAYIAPQAADNVWYPNPFIAPLEANEPYLGAALNMITNLIQRAEKTVPAQRVVLLGFSQGGCLTLEYAARNPRRYGAIVGLSASLIGPPGMARDYPGSLDGTPAFLGASDPDPYFQRERVDEAAAVLERMGAAVTLRLYPNMGHMVSEDELAIIREMTATI